MIEAPDFLPLGSIVSLKGNDKKLMIIGRGIVIAPELEKQYFDYSFVLYPEGVIGDALIFGQHEQIEVVHHKGCSDEEDTALLERLLEALKAVDVPRGDPDPVEMEW